MKAPKSKYKYVYYHFSSGKYINWRATVKRTKGYKTHSIHRVFKNERDAALAVDKFLISINEEPVNILKRKQLLYKISYKKLTL